MIEGQSIVCFAHDWEGDPTSKTHIMRILARRNRVLWINSIGLRRPRATGHDLRRLAFKLKRTFAGCREVEPNLMVANPLAIPGVRALEGLNAWMLAAWLRRLCRRLALKDPLLWTFMPNVGWALGRIQERLVVYHCVDEYSAFSGVPTDAIHRMERDLVGRADLVLTSSQQLADERRGWNANTHYVPHGVDVDHFARALDPATVVPADLRDLPHPVIGFFGLIADWVDVELIRRIALARPHWSIVLIGRHSTDLAPLAGVPNVHRLGLKPYSSLPGYCRDIDVGIIPFKLNRLTLRANPLKMREYLAAGLPVVSTTLPEVEKYGGLVRTAEGAREFVAQIERALDEGGPAMCRRRVETIAAESWERRVSEISALLHLSMETS